MPEDRRREALFVYRKITVLRCVPCCGLCGTTRHHTKPYWSLGMRVCRHCVQANLISSHVLYERYWVTMGQPVQAFGSLVEAVSSRVFYFSTRMTPNQRLDFSCDRMDFTGGIRTIWFFWKPHLMETLNMGKLEREGKEKHAAASIIRSITRRALILRALNGTAGRRAPTVYTGQVFNKRDLRCTEFRLRKVELLDKMDAYNVQPSLYRLSLPLFKRLNDFEDRVGPLMFN